MKTRIADHPITLRKFNGIDPVLRKLKGKRKLPDRKASEKVNRTLLELIEREKEPCFLLPAVLHFVKRVDEEKILHHYTFNSFEIWLNQYSGLSFEQNYRVRGKIAGKYIERYEYQNLFPIGMGKVYEGTHFVTAHKSPDLDTTIASFWGWLDAFAARVGDGLHVWNLPDGPPPSQIEIEWIFRDLFGDAVFSHLPKTRTTLSLTANDLVTQKGLKISRLENTLAEIDHAKEQNAVIVVDDKGFFLGDWRLSDVEGVRQVILLLSSCLRWFENQLHLRLISLFAKKDLHIRDVSEVLSDLLVMEVRDCEPAREFSERQYYEVDLFAKHVLDIEEGLIVDFEGFARILGKLGKVPFGGVEGLISKMKAAKLFNAKGQLIAKRPQIFTFLEGSIQALHRGIVQIRAKMETLDIALKTKLSVFSRKKTFVTVRSEVEEIQSKMGNHTYLSVVYPDGEKFFPVGIIQAEDVRKKTLGTVSLRDFCNKDEMGIPSYLEVISVIDHHKSSLNTFSPPMAIISDVQSSNTLVALKAFEINDKNRSKPSFVHRERQYLEYLHFLYGIIDDTDLLSKVSVLDIEVVASLLNRLKSLSSKAKKKIVDLRSIPKGPHYAANAAKKILQTEEMYSLYRKVYEYREKEVAKNLINCAKNLPSNLFADTKEQNGCCRVGQTKMFAANIQDFEKHKKKIQKRWIEQAEKIQSEKREIRFHIHMISTIVSAEEVYRGKEGEYDHLDELWIWTENDELGGEKLRKFLNAFKASPGLKENAIEVEFLGTNHKELEQLFKESFLDVPMAYSHKGLNISVIKYRAGTLNSRKAMVSPFLPKNMPSG